MRRPELVAVVLAFLTCAMAAPQRAAAQETEDAETEESAPAAAQEAPAQDDLDLEMAGWPLLVVSAVLWVQYVFARTQIDAFNSDPRVDAYRVVIGATDPESTDICANAEASVGNTEAAYVRGACRRGADAEARGWAFLTLGLLTAATGIVLIAVDLAIEPSAPMTLSFGPGRIDVSGSF
jgi:hypothetical protein